MPLRLHIAAISLLLITAVTVRAATEDQAAQLHRLSGLEAVIDSYPAQMRQDIEQQSGALPPPLEQAWFASAVAAGLRVNALLPEGQHQSPALIREQMSAQLEQLSSVLK